MVLQRVAVAQAQQWAVRCLPSAAVRTTSRSFVSSTTPLLEKRVMKVPTMGDAITEGTIVEWAVDVGQAVKEGQVVALVETDKVTVDLKAEIDGVVTQHFGKVDDTVEVGGDLYEIDTDAEASAAPKETRAEETPENEKEQPAAFASASEEASEQTSGSGATSHRTPSIHFLGKEGWAKLKSGEKPDSVTSTSPSKQRTTITVSGPISPMYGRPLFTDEEMEALVMGGATLAPEVVAVSGGAKFK